MSVVIGMSGGVDSATAAALLKDLGERVIGVTLHFSEHSACCDLASTHRAKAQCERLGIEWHQVEMKELFACRVIEPFWKALATGVTPNPCVFCNEYIKWQGLLDLANELGADFIATGHYAGIRHSQEGDRICRGVDAAKDQSYFLYRLTAEQRRRVVFPLAARTKRDVMQLTGRWFSPDLIAKRESQDLCFIEGPFPEEAARHLQLQAGNIVTADGTVLGRHHGLALYTVGQREGLGIGGGGTPFYVLAKRQQDNCLIVGTREQCMRSSFDAVDLKWQHLPTEQKAVFDADVVTRYRAHAVRGVVKRISAGRVSVQLEVPVFAVTPGQAAVFYHDTEIIGGGTVV